MPPERRLIYALINRELRRGQINNTVTDRWPGEPPLLQPLRHQHHAAAVPRQQLHSVRALRAKNEHIASVWIGSKHFAHQCGQGVNRLPEIDRLCRYPDLEVGAKRDHRQPRNYCCGPSSRSTMRRNLAPRSAKGVRLSCDIIRLTTGPMLQSVECSVTVQPSLL